MRLSFQGTAFRLEIIKVWELTFILQGSNSGVLCKAFPLFALDQMVELEENDIDLRTYSDRENLAWKMLSLLKDRYRDPKLLGSRYE
jgi:hypothetical protein